MKNINLNFKKVLEITIMLVGSASILIFLTALFFSFRNFHFDSEYFFGAALMAAYFSFFALIIQAILVIIYKLTNKSVKMERIIIIFSLLPLINICLFWIFEA